MKHLIILIVTLLLIQGCNGSKDRQDIPIEPVEPAKVWIEQTLTLSTGSYPESSYFGGTVNYDESTNSYETISHTNMNCVLDNGIAKPLKSGCKKAIFQMSTLENDSNYVEGRVTKYTSSFTVNSINLDTPPDWIIIFQDWVDIDQNDSNGNHPISTLKLKVNEGQLSINHYENSWQFNHAWDVNDPEDADHTLHQINDLHGSVNIDVGVEYNVEIIITDGINDTTGNLTVTLNEVEFSNVDYQTKFDGYTNNAVHSFGQYMAIGYDIGLEESDFDGQYNKEAYGHVLYSPANQINITFNNVKKYLLDN